MDLSSEVFGDADDECCFFSIGHAQYRHARSKLLAEAVHELAKGVAVNGCDLADHGFDAFDGLGRSGKVVELRKRAFALLVGEFLFEVFDRRR